MISVGHIAGWVRRRRALRRRFNPYIAGTPVFDRQLFYGRQALALQTLELLGSHSVELAGERRIGKTSFLHHLKRVLREHAGERLFFPVFVDLEAVTASSFFHALMEETVETLALSPRALAELRFSGEHNGYGAHDFSHDLRRVVEDLRGRAQQQVSLVLLIDEVDALREDPHPIGDPWLAFLEDCSQDLRVVLAGVGRGSHGTLDAVELEPFTPEEAEALVIGPVAGVFRYEPRAVERILQLSGRRPYPIQRLCLHAVNLMLDEGRTTVWPRDVEAASREAGLRQVFSVDERN